MYCKKCGKEFTGKFCVECGEPAEPTNNTQTKPKKAFYKTWWFWLIVIVVAIGAIGGGGDNTENNTETGTNVKTNVSKNEVQTIQIGETITTDDYEITVTKVEQKNKVGSQYLSSTPADGGTYVCVQWKYKNISSEPKSSWDFPSIKLLDGNDVKYSSDISASSYYATETDPDRKIMSDLNPQITTSDSDVFEVSKELYANEGWKLLIDTDKDFYVEIK